MSPPSPDLRDARGALDSLSRAAPVFAALGDEARLRILGRLCADGPASIANLTDGSGLTRQSVTKHLRVLEEAGLVHGTREGRTSRWELRPERLARACLSLELISRRWDETLGRLKALVEE